jgi:transcription termination factor Rho
VETELAFVMKTSSQSIKPRLLLVMAGIIAVLIVVSGWLATQNRQYQSHNRKLIIQNDSIMAVNIELLQVLEGKVEMPKKHVLFSLKSASK